MALNAGTVAAVLTLDSSRFSSGLAGARSALAAFGSHSLSVTEKVKKIANAAGSLGATLTKTVTTAAIGAATACTMAYANLEEGLLKASTIADASILSMDDMADGLKDMATQSGQSTSSLAEGLYQVLSATNDSANAMGYLEIAMKTAVGGFTDTNTAVDGLTTVLNAYGQSGAAAMGAIADKMLIAQNYGKTTAGEIASSIGNVAKTAESLNVGISELMSSVAVLTKNGLGTSEAITGLKAAFSNILKPTAEADAVAKQLGIDFSAAALQTMGFSEFLHMVGEACNGDTQLMSQLFGSVEALNSMLIMTGETGAKDFQSAMSQMGASAGAVDSAYETMTGSVSSQFAKLKQSGVTLLQDFGELLAPTAEKVIGWASNALDFVRNLDDGTKRLIITVGGVAAAVGPVLIVGSKIAALMAGPVGIITLVLAAAAGVGMLIYQLGSASAALEDFWATTDQSRLAEMKAGFEGMVTVDTEGTKTSVESAISQIKAVIGATLTDDEVNAVVDMINGKIDPIEAALSTFDVTDPEGFKAAVREASAAVYLALSKAGLSDKQAKYIAEECIGADYQTIYDALLGFGLSPEDAVALAGTVTNINGAVSGAWDGFDLLSETDRRKLTQMVTQDNLALSVILAQMGLSDSVISWIVSLLMIRSYYNHPSILFWGMFNEIGGSHYYAPGASATSDPQGGYSESKAKGWVAELAPYMRGLLEDGRFVGGAVNDRAFSDMANAATWDIDYIGINRYDGWYGGVFTHFGSRMTNAHTSDAVHPYAVTEYGAGANPLTHSETPLTTTDIGSGGARHDEEFQNLFHESYVEQIQARSWLCFTAVWAFIDFAVAARNEGGTPYINDKGLVTRDRATKKDAYFLYKALWQSAPVAYITSRRFTQRTAASIAVKCYANTDTLTLAIDGVDVQTLTAATKCGVIWEFTAAAFAVGEHTITVRGSKGGVQTTDSVTFEVVTVTPVSVATQPTDVSGAVGTNAVYTVVASGTGSLTYQWQYSSDGTIWSASTLEGYATATFTVPITAARDGFQYRCVISDGYGNTAVSNGAYLHVAAGALSISSQPASASGASGASVTLTVGASGGTSPYTYLWQYYDTATSAWVNVGCTTASYALTVSAANDGVGYRCIVSDSASGSVTSSTATVTMAAADAYTELGTLSANSTVGTAKAWYSVNLAAGTYQYRVVTTGSTPNSAITTVLCRAASSGSDSAGTALFSYTGNQTTNGQTLTGTFTLAATAPYLYFAFTPNTGSTFAATLSIIE